MFSPLPLRLCCMAAMAPALTEAATQARVKIPTSPPLDPQTTTLINGRDCQSPNLTGDERGLVRSVSNLVSKTQLPSLISTRINPCGSVQARSLNNLGTLKTLPEICKQRGLTGHTAKLNGDLHNSEDGGGMNQNSTPIMNSVNSQHGQSVNKTTGMGQQTGNTTTKQAPPVALTPTLPPSTGTAPTAEQDGRVPITSQRHTTNGNTVRTTVTTNSIVAPDTESVVQDSVIAPSKVDTELLTESNKRQHQLEKRAAHMMKRIRRLQTRQSSAHVSQQLSGFVDHQHKNLQSIAKAMKVPTSTPEIKTEVLQSEDVKSLSTAQLVNLVRKLQSTQAITLRQRLTNNSSASDTKSVLTLNKDHCDEIQQVSGHLQTNLKHLESAVDSDATESSSGGESCDEGEYDIDYEPRHTLAPLHRRAEWKWAMDRAAVAARWTWLQAQVSDLEYRIRQQSDIYRQIRATKGTVVLGDPPSPEDLMSKFRPSRTGRKLSPIEAKIAAVEKRNEMSPCNLSTLLSNVDKQSAKLTQSLGNCYSPLQGSPLVNSTKSRTQTPPKAINGFIDPTTNHSSQNHSPEGDVEIIDPVKKNDHQSPSTNNSEAASPVIDSTCQAARCRPVRSYRKRKLLRTTGLHQLSRKAARLSKVKCHCYPPSMPCAMCGGRYNNCHSLDSDVMPLHERVSLLDTAFHPVLSFSQDIPLPVQFESLLKSGEWQNKPSPKPIKALTSEKKKPKLSSPLNDGRRHKKLSKSYSSSLLKLRNRIEGKQLSRSHGGSLPSTPKHAMSNDTRLCRSELKKRKAALAAVAIKKERRLSLPEHQKQRNTPSPTPRETPSPFATSYPSSTFKELKEATIKKRRGESAFDINNVIPYGHYSTRVEKLQYKEILTPKWREVPSYDVKPIVEHDGSGDASEHKPAPKEETDPMPEEKEGVKEKERVGEKEGVDEKEGVVDEKEGVVEKVEEKEKEKDPAPVPNGLVTTTKVKVEAEETEKEAENEEDEEEDMSDQMYEDLHAKCEIQEKKRFVTFFNINKRTINRNSSNRTDSGTTSPDPLSPEASLNSDSLFSSSLNKEASLSTPPATPSASKLTPAAVSGEDANMAGTSYSRRRSGSIGSKRDRALSINEDRASTPDLLQQEYPIVAPFEPRKFPLTEEDLEVIRNPAPEIPEEMPVSAAPTPLSVKSTFSYESATPENSNPCSPLPSSSASSIIEDDPNDPEWTVVNNERQATTVTKSGIVLKLAKR